MRERERGGRERALKCSCWPQPKIHLSASLSLSFIYIPKYTYTPTLLIFHHSHQLSSSIPPPPPPPPMTMITSNGSAQSLGDTSLTKVFVGGLAWETPKEAMRDHFEKYGDVLEAVIISDKLTGRSKGYGFVSLRLRRRLGELLSLRRILIDRF